jgi:hypothetical protein
MLTDEEPGFSENSETLSRFLDSIIRGPARIIGTPGEWEHGNPEFAAV